MRNWLAAGAGLVAFAAVSVWWSQSGPDAADFPDLTTPRITHLQDQRMLVVEAVGDPNQVAGDAFKLLFAAYYQAPGVSRWQKPPAPRARWRQSVSTRRSEWVGRYGLPVAAAVTAAPPVDAQAGMRVGLETWKYGDVAEVLHVGPYSAEETDIVALQAFAAASGRRIIGDHEEEYVRGPGMIFAGDPLKYLTIIRLQLAPPSTEPPVD
jgi:hypothetical protein